MKKWIISAVIILSIVCIGAAAAFAADSTAEISLSGEKAGDVYTSDITGDISIDNTELEISRIKVMLGSDRILEADTKSSAYIHETFSITEKLLKKYEPEKGNRYTLVIKKVKGTSEEESQYEFKADVSVPELVSSEIRDNGAYKDEKTFNVNVTDGNKKDETYSVKYMFGSKELFKGSVTGTHEFKTQGEGNYSVTAVYSDSAGRKLDKTYNFVIDKTKPETGKIDLSGSRNEGSSIYNDKVILQADVTDDHLLESVTIRINGKTVMDKKSIGSKRHEIDYEITRSWLEKNARDDNRYVIELIAEDAAGNVSESKAEMLADVVIPQLKISGVEHGDCVNTSPVIKLDIADNDAEHCRTSLKISKDGKAYDDTLMPGSHAEYKSITSDGVYDIEVFTEDAAGNRSQTQKLSFIRDTRGPEICDSSISGHRKKGYTWFDSSVNITSDISDKPAGISKIDVTVNGEPLKSYADFKDSETENISIELSKSWFKENESESGKYTIKIYAEDKAGNSSVEKLSFFADTEAPKISLSGIENGTFTNKTLKVADIIDDNYADMNRNTIEVRRNGKLYKKNTVTAAESSFNGFGKDGDYEIIAVATDKAGNTSKSNKIKFTKDTVAPKISLSGAEEGSYTKGAKDIKASVVEHNYSNMKVSAVIIKVLEGKKSTVSFGKIVPSGEHYSKVKRLNSTGTYKVTLQAQDKAGNTSSPVTLKFTIDNEKPVIKISGVKKINGYDSNIAPKIEYKDSYFKSKKITLTRASGKSVSSIVSREKKSEYNGRVTLSGFDKKRSFDDIYTLACTVTDKAGNTSSKKVTFIVDRFGSRFRIPKNTGNYNNSYIQSLDDSLVIVEKNYAGLKEHTGILTKDGQRTDADIRVLHKKASDGSDEYRYVFDKELFAEEGVYVLNTKSKDKAGNASELSEARDTFRVSIDKTKPVIAVSGIEADGIYKGDAVVRVSATDNVFVADCKVYFGDEIIYEYDKVEASMQAADVKVPYGIGQTIKVVAKDAAGNTSVRMIENVTVSDNILKRLWANKLLITILAAAVVIIAIAVIYKFTRRRKENEAEE